LRSAGLSDARLRRLPKAELHVHLDGSLRPSTMIELAAERGVPLPASDPEELERRLVANHAHSLGDDLTAFEVTVSVMQDAPALDRLAYELAEDQAVEHVRYAEVRFCPLLNTQGGLAPEDVLTAVLAGLERARNRLDIRSRVIVCALRHLPPSSSVELAELAVSMRDRGVCGFDLAGPEAGHPVRTHAEAFALARRYGLPVTIHAGEAAGPESIREALDVGHASRIGHGTRLWEDPELVRRVLDDGITLEICLTSNVQTHAVAAYEAHPLRRYYDLGIPVVLCTDNRLVSGVTLTGEYVRARDTLGFSWEELTRIAATGFSSAFAPTDIGT
jgi:adenosine deaminase